MGQDRREQREPSRYDSAARGVAQPGSALRSGRRGPQFESGHPDQGRGGTNTRFPHEPSSLGHDERADDDCDERLGAFYARCMLRAVVFDVDFTLARPGPDLGPEGYHALGLRYGLKLDASLYEQARAAALAEVRRHPELDHEEEVWVLFTERIIVGMGGRGDTYRAAVEMEQRWAHSAHFELFDDALPALEFAREIGLKIGLLSNSSRNLDEFVAHHGLAVDAVLTSFSHGKTKPHESIFLAVLELLEVAPAEAVMVGDTLNEDIEGALAVGMRAVLLDRDGRHPEVSGRLETLHDLPAALLLD